MNPPTIIHFASRGQILQLTALFGQRRPWILEMLRTAYSDAALQAFREEVERRKLAKLLPPDMNNWE